MKTPGAVGKDMRLFTDKELQRIADKMLEDSYGTRDTCDTEDVMDALEWVDADIDELVIDEG